MKNSRAWVYVVDDSPDYLFLIGQVFKRFLPQYPVHFFASGEACFEHLSGTTEDKPGLILMDMHMPGWNGIQTLAAIRSAPSWRRVPLVIMSNAASQPERDACYEAGASSFTAKPMDFNQCQETLTSICHYWLRINEPASA